MAKEINLTCKYCTIKVRDLGRGLLRIELNDPENPTPAGYCCFDLSLPEDMREEEDK